MVLIILLGSRKLCNVIMSLEFISSPLFEVSYISLVILSLFSKSNQLVMSRILLESKSSRLKVKPTAVERTTQFVLIVVRD